jgi:pimeloyl-ACP methyl ester carboxylesterase
MLKKYLPHFLKFFSLIFPRLSAKIAIKLFATPIRIPRPLSEKNYFESSKKSFLKNGIATFEWGEAHHPIVFLIHGWNGRGTQLGAFSETLVPKGFRVIAFDGPGHGISPGKETNPKAYADFIIDAQKELAPNGIKAVIAHSFGGGCSVLAGKNGLLTEKFVLVASPAFYERVTSFFAKSLKLSEKSYECFIQEIMKRTNLHPRELDIGKMGSALNKSCLVIHDAEDNAVDVLSAHAIHKAWPHSEIMLTTGLGHRRILRSPEVLSRVTSFISN